MFILEKYELFSQNFEQKLAPFLLKYEFKLPYLWKNMISDCYIFLKILKNSKYKVSYF